jgi:hypothetical protein
MTSDVVMSNHSFNLSLFPAKKEELNNYGIVPVPYSSHSIVNYEAWFSQSTFKLLETGSLEGQEPYYIGRRDYPLFEEIYIGCGQDKVAHPRALIYYNYTFWISPELFAIHLDSTGMGTSWCNVESSVCANIKIS